MAQRHEVPMNRRANLYGISSKKRLPRVHVAIADARARKELQLLHQANPAVSNGAAIYEHEQEARKHQEHLGMRPPLDQLHALQDLTTTVPKPREALQSRQAKQHKEWRVGYTNKIDGHWHAGVSGAFQPTDGQQECFPRQHLAQTTKTPWEAYPLRPEDSDPRHVEAILDPVEHQDSVPYLRVKDNEKDIVGGANQRHSQAWMPSPRRAASHAKTHHSKSQKIQQNTTNPSNSTRTVAFNARTPVQRFPVRKVTKKLAKAALQTDARCVNKRKQELAEATRAYNLHRHRADKAKQPHLRYSLPIESPQQTRAYRLGLESMPSAGFSASEPDLHLLLHFGEDETGEDSPRSPNEEAQHDPPQRVLFRPRSAAALVQHLRGSKSMNALEPTEQRGKVAGALRRPHSASVCYLSNSTLYCFDQSSTRPSTAHPPASSALSTPPGAETQATQPSHAGMTTAHSILDQERNKRQQNRLQILEALARKSTFRELALPQVYARLRREAVANLSRTVVLSKYEQMSFDAFVRSCGLELFAYKRSRFKSRGRDRSKKEDENGGGDGTGDSPEPTVDAKLTLDSEQYVGVLANPLLLRSENQLGTGAAEDEYVPYRRILFISRQQLHTALESFALASRDVNRLYSALDLSVTDRVEVWEVLWAIDAIQERERQLRRARIQMKPRGEPPNMEILRQSILIPRPDQVEQPI